MSDYSQSGSESDYSYSDDHPKECFSYKIISPEVEERKYNWHLRPRAKYNEPDEMRFLYIDICQTCHNKLDNSIMMVIGCDERDAEDCLMVYMNPPYRNYNLSLVRLIPLFERIWFIDELVSGLELCNSFLPPVEIQTTFQVGRFSVIGH